jgi:hypothetical protein
LANLAKFHSELALVIKTCFVAYKILHKFLFGENLTSVQLLVDFCKKTERGKWGKGG